MIQKALLLISDYIPRDLQLLVYKFALVLIAIFSFYVFIKYLSVFNSLSQVTLSNLECELDDPPYKQERQRNLSFSQSAIYALVVMVKLAFLIATTFVMAWFSEIQGLLPREIVWGLYGVGLGVLLGWRWRGDWAHGRLFKKRRVMKADLDW